MITHEITDTAPIQKHGSIPYGELRSLGISPSQIVDFSATVNPYPLPESIRDRFTSLLLSSYPDLECNEALESLAEYHAIDRNTIALSAGTTEIIFALPQLFCHPCQLAPTYGDYRAAFTRKKIDLKEIPYPKTESDWIRTKESLLQNQYDLLIICNPNNPNGLYVDKQQIETLCVQFPHMTIFVDESYQEMSLNCKSVKSLLHTYQNLMIIKSLTKPFGIGGIRAGYALSSPKRIATIKELLLPWGVSSIGQQIVPLFFQNLAHFAANWKAIHEEKKRLCTGLQELGFEVWANQCPFFLVKTENSTRLRNTLLVKHHLIVRDCTSFGLAGTIRIMPSLPKHNDSLLEAMALYR